MDSPPDITLWRPDALVEREAELHLAEDIKGMTKEVDQDRRQITNLFTSRGLLRSGAYVMAL